jgi:hypothetical protein
MRPRPKAALRDLFLETKRNECWAGAGGEEQLGWGKNTTWSHYRTNVLGVKGECRAEVERERERDVDGGMGIEWSTGGIDREDTWPQVGILLGVRMMQ